MKRFIKKVLQFSGYEIKKLKPTSKQSPVPYDKRPVGEMNLLLEDLSRRGLTCKTILDIGANKADWSRLTKKVFPAANFCLIEPQIEMTKELEQFCRDFEGSTYLLAGAGAKKGHLTFTVWEDLVGSSFFPQADERLKNAGKQREVEIVTVDDLLSSSKLMLPELIKIDVQGYELEVLKGASQTFGRTEVYILEVSLFPFFQGLPIFLDVVNFMAERGYVVYDFPGFLRRPLDGALGQCDICFVKKDGFLRSNTTW